MTDNNNLPLTLVILQRPQVSKIWNRRGLERDRRKRNKQQPSFIPSDHSKQTDTKVQQNDTDDNDDDDDDDLVTPSPPPSGELWPVKMKGEVETICRLVQNSKTYIPFNPYTGAKEIANRRISNHGDEYYISRQIDPTLMHTLPNGSQLPLYRWQYRNWMFRRFDEGIKYDVNGFMEITPEPIAKHIARSLRQLTPACTDRTSCKDRIFRRDSKTSSQVEMEKEEDEEEGAYKEETEEKIEEEEQEKLERRDEYTVLDGCCGYGGNTIQLAQEFQSVIAIDVDPERIIMAQHNADLYDAKGIEWVNRDFVEWCMTVVERRKKESVDRQLSNKMMKTDSTYEKTSEQPSALNVSTEGATSDSKTTTPMEHDEQKTTKSKVNQTKVNQTKMNQTKMNQTKVNQSTSIDERLLSSSIAQSTSSSLSGQSMITSSSELLNQQQLYLWAFISPPWGGGSYKDRRVFEMKNVAGCDIWNMVIAAASVARNVCLYLPANQYIDEVIELASLLPHCAAIMKEAISIGLKKQTKYVVVKYIDEKTAEIAFPNFHLRASQFLVDELEEQPAMSHSFQFLIKQIGVREMFVCLEEALGVASRGGMVKLDQPGEKRTRGGVFFQVVKKKHPQAYKDLNKSRKAHIAEKFIGQKDKRKGKGSTQKAPK